MTGPLASLLMLRVQCLPYAAYCRRCRNACWRAALQSSYVLMLPHVHNTQLSCVLHVPGVARPVHNHLLLLVLLLLLLQVVILVLMLFCRLQVLTRRPTPAAAQLVCVCWTLRQGCHQSSHQT